ncbi:MAG: serine hydrolase domain-containing protein [Phycisphaerae bacterium]
MTTKQNQKQKQPARGLQAARACACALAGAEYSLAELPITGMPVPELANFDQLMVDYLEANDVKGAVLGIMKDGVIVYQRGFGWKDNAETIPLRHDAVMRIASITKPFTAVAIQKLYASGALEPDDSVFDLGQPGGGVLAYSAFDGGQFRQYPNVPDSRMQDITVQQILSHNSGLPTNDGSEIDPMFNEIQIAQQFNDAGFVTSNPPGAIRTAQWALGRTLANDPGAVVAYSNFGFMVLGQVVEAVAGMSHFEYVTQNVLEPIPWLPMNDVVYGRSFESQLDPREPYYDNTQMVTNVFDPGGDDVRRPHGGYHHELHFASGAFVSGTTALLHLAENYYIQAEDFNDGLATTYGAPTNGVRPDPKRSHGGRLFGTATWLRQRPDGVNFAVLTNKGLADDPLNQLRGLIDAELDDGGFTWPTRGVDGQWVDLDRVPLGNGSYESPWKFFGIALVNCPDKATLNFQSGSSGWTGTVNQRVRLRAPQEGVVVRIGQP